MFCSHEHGFGHGFSTYLNNIYSCRKIEEEIRVNILFMWLAGGLEPDHNTINRFRSTHLKKSINKIFTQVVQLLVEIGYLSLDRDCVDGIQLDSYTFDWRQMPEQNRGNLDEKIRKVLEFIEKSITR